MDTNLTTAPALLATGILRARARALEIAGDLWPENTPFDLTSSARRAFMSPPDHGERRRKTYGDDETHTGVGIARRA